MATAKNPRKAKAGKPATPTRRRRTAEEARHEILAAAQRRLAEGGPEAIRLQDIARDLGISHPTILHHFESREGLMQALGRSAMSALNADIMRAISDPGRGTSPEAVLDRVFETLGESGHARLLAWSALGDFAPQRTRGVVPQEQVLRVLADAVHRRLGDEARATGARTPPREEADFTVRLVAAAMLGDALVGDVLSRTAGLPDGPAVQRRFRAWLARLLDERFRQVTCTTRRGGRD
ncbi:TetR/AcrR family transcriptional regulator [Candidatus Binatia bacterium]|nr:TetR/AcrR family transcriptional regulator [Candidatus Binatia bacterium]